MKIVIAVRFGVYYQEQSYLSIASRQVLKLTTKTTLPEYSSAWVAYFTGNQIKLILQGGHICPAPPPYDF